MLFFRQVSVVGVDGRLVYESLVRPDNDIIDYNTRYSGISAKDFGKHLKHDMMDSGLINLFDIQVFSFLTDQKLQNVKSLIITINQFDLIMSAIMFNHQVTAT